ncbi:hypothetical protein H7J77_09365 [Mycolicibacillus parakoreensis]|uniref:DUF7937 domain-containing protein n=1 Tax=Mycolicibacillus parakoreensis TaxID=1069221 RepID=A0ABY3U0Z7_9MYCO|nr:hypothetical protein [Mycolicibacillus parakoreensis]MCV7315747.1 hypothetical protein [Mycolicibacillus parakoreensis]ULN51821.1 hypothetical protein MIU77_13125 [Mycolicibacillus parakoreensis]
MSHPRTPVSTGTGDDRVRLVAAAVLLIAGLLLPWNIHVGLGIGATGGWVYGVYAGLVAVTLAALVPPVAAWRGRDGAAARLRGPLTLPYLLVVAAFTAVTIVAAVRHTGSGAVAPGVGPGALLGLAGALLAAGPPVGSDREATTAAACRVLGWVSIVAGGGAALLNLYLRTRFVLPDLGGQAGTANLVTAVAAVLFSVVAVLPVLIAGRWLITGGPAARLATVLLGGSAALAATLVWVLPVGRDLDGFHGIAQNTGTAGVGFEGYLVWVAAAALLGPRSVAGLRSGGAARLWPAAARSALLLIAAWCAGTAVLRITGVGLTAVLALPGPPYNSTALMAADVIAAVLAVWLALNGVGAAAPRAVSAVLFATLVVVAVCRLILGVALVPRSAPLNPGVINAVFGNSLSQQITSTFDVTVVVLAAVLLVGAWAAEFAPRPAARPAAAPETAPPRIAAPRIAAADPSAPRIATPPDRPETAPRGDQR